jgi:drug/metabolite transporter superfamily protein YnfA
MAAAICFLFGGWALWQSRQPQNRETGHVGKAIAGLALCGLFATMGVWVNKAAITASGGNATINNSPAMVQFGTAG